MKLSLYTDYTLRVLIYLGARPEQLCSIGDIAEAYRISQNHLVKVAHDLGKAGYVAASRGRSGGIRLAQAPETVIIGNVVRQTEGEARLVDCAACVIAPVCRLQCVLAEAMAAFWRVLDHYTLADLLSNPADIRRLLG